jgi:transposase
VADLITAGIDVSKDHLDVAVRPGTRFRVAHDPAGAADLVTRLADAGPALVVLEATGGYEADALAALLAAGIPAAVVNPRRVRQFASGVGQHAKTDAIDAAVLAHFAAVARPDPVAPAGPDRAELAALLDRRRQLLGMRVAEGNRLRPGVPAAVREGIESHVAWLDGQVEAIDREVAAAVRRTPAWREKDRLLRSIKGVGPVVSHTLLADLPELGALPPGKLSALAGLAPFAADSGRAARRAAHPRRPAGGAEGAVHGRAGGGPGAGAASRVRPAAEGEGEGVEGRPDRGRTEALGDRRRRHPGRPPVGPENGPGRLTSNTVAGSASSLTARQILTCFNVRSEDSHEHQRTVLCASRTVQRA